MLYKEIIKLISKVYTTNDIGNTLEAQTKRTVFASKKSIRQSEFYQAQATGLKPEIAFEVRTIEYRNEESLEYNNKEYKILRTYDKDGEMTELICQGIVGTEVRNC